MVTLTWICIGINALAALFLVTVLFNPNQDAAGKSIIALPIIILLVCAAASFFLMNRHYKITAFTISAVPAVIAVYMLFLTMKK